MRRRLLLLITDLQIGGTPAVVRELALRLRDDAHVEVACLSESGPVADQLRDAGVGVTPFGANRPRQLPMAIRKLVSLIREGHFDTVFSFLIHANTVAALASLFCGETRFIQSIQTTQPNPRWHWLLQRWVHHAADTVVVPSNSVARVAELWSDVPVSKSLVIPNAVSRPPSPSNLGEGGGEARAPEALGLSPTLSKGTWRGRVGFLGRLDPIKRVPDLVEALARLRNHEHLHIFGDGEDRPRIERRVRELSLLSRVTMHGTIAEPRRAMREIDVLVLPSQAEGFGLVLIEAMAAGIPVIGTNVPGIRDVIRDGVNGLLVPMGDPTALARAIERVGSSPALREKLIAGGLRDVRQRFDWSAVLPMYRRLLQLDRP